jgi:hypothetical protein
LAIIGKAHAVVLLAEAGDLLVAARILVAELVARKAQHHQPALAIAFHSVLQAGELRREAAGAGGC